MSLWLTLEKTQAYCEMGPFDVNYGTVMFYSIGLRIAAKHYTWVEMNDRDLSISLLHYDVSGQCKKVL
jgi:hypothetical protein